MIVSICPIFPIFPICLPHPIRSARNPRSTDSEASTFRTTGPLSDGCIAGIVSAGPFFRTRCGSWWSYHQALCTVLRLAGLGWALSHCCNNGWPSVNGALSPVGVARLEMKDAVLAGCKEVRCVMRVRPGQSRHHLDLQHIWQRLTDHFGTEIVPRFERVALQVCGDQRLPNRQPGPFFSLLKCRNFFSLDHDFLYPEF